MKLAIFQTSKKQVTFDTLTISQGHKTPNQSLLLICMWLPHKEGGSTYFVTIGNSKLCRKHKGGRNKNVTYCSSASIYKKRKKSRRVCYFNVIKTTKISDTCPIILNMITLSLEEVSNVMHLCHHCSSLVAVV